METACPLLEFRVHKMAGKWHVWMGFSLKEFSTKREAVSWCKRAAKEFHKRTNDYSMNDDGTFHLSPEYEVVARLKQLLLETK